MPKKVLCAFPPTMLEQIDFIASAEHRTRSDLIREAIRRYVDNFKRSQGPLFDKSNLPPNLPAVIESHQVVEQD